MASFGLNYCAIVMNIFSIFDRTIERLLCSAIFKFAIIKEFAKH